MPKTPKTITVSRYDWKITVKKFFTGLLYAVIPFSLAYLIGFLETEEFPPEYAGYITLAIAILHLVTNYLKHYNDTKEVPV